MKVLKLSAALAFALFVYAWGYSSLMRVGPLGGHDLSVLTRTAYGRVATLALSMVVGIFAQAIHEQIQNKPHRRLGILEAALKSEGLIAAISVSPIIFLSIYKLTSDQPDGVIAFCLSFQNGFFWKTIFSVGARRNEQAGNSPGSNS